MKEDQLPGWTTRLFPSHVQHYVKAGKKNTACSRYTIYDYEKPLLVTMPDNKRKFCKACAKIHNKEKRRIKP